YVESPPSPTRAGVSLRVYPGPLMLRALLAPACLQRHILRHRSKVGGVASAAVGQDDATPPLAMPDGETLPRQIGTYLLLRRIGKGAMGAVYEALQAQPQRHVALKLIRADQVSEE